MKMARWVLEDNQKGMVTISKGELPPKPIRKEIYGNNKVKFKLVYNEQYKMVGYQFDYKAPKATPRFSLFNCFGIVYNQKPQVKKESLELEILYEDQVLRLLAYRHPTGVRDFLLIGRWRTEAEAPNEEDDA